MKLLKRQNRRKTGSKVLKQSKKIIWPDRKSLTKETVAVVAASVLLGVIIAIVDFIARIGIEFLVK